MAAGYPYTSLDPSKKQIRLLEFSSKFLADSAAVLRCRLRTVSLADKPLLKYSAISWYWGDANVRSNIVVDGHTVSVPRNAEVALRYLHHQQPTYPRKLRSKSFTNRLWLDAICINQYDLTERGSQVAMMASIYSEARLVLVWLGEPNSMTERATASLKLIYEQCRAHLSYAEDIDRELYTDGIWLQRLSEPLPFQIDWPALSDLFWSDWFDRLWVVQEFALSKTAFCYQGNYCMHWTTLVRAARWLREWLDLHPEERHYLRGIYRCLGLANLRAGDRAGGGAGCKIKGRHAGECRIGRCCGGDELLGLLTDFGSRICTNPRDKIYALLGLMRPETAARIVPDYTAPLKDVFAIATALSITESADLGIWDQRTRGSASWDSYRSQSWPTWVPHLAEQTDPATDVLALPSGYTADCGIRAIAQHKLDNLGSLSLLGVKVDTINSISPMIERTGTWWRVEDCKTLLCIAYEQMSGASCFPAGQNAAQVLAYTITAGPRLNGQLVSEPNSEWEAKFAALVQTVSDVATGDLRELAISQLASGRVDFRDYLRAAGEATERRCFYTTSSGLFGLCPGNAAKGDEVCILFGSRTPHVLRAESDHWLLVGNCYAHGVMDVSSMAGWASTSADQVYRANTFVGCSPRSN